MKYKLLILSLFCFINLIKGRNKIPDGFMLLDENEPNGPITLNRELDDGTKRNLYSLMRQENDSFYYNQAEFDSLQPIILKGPEYICEVKSYDLRPELQKGHELSCPKYYTIKINKAFYGRHANDMQHCTNYNVDPNRIKNECGNDVTTNVKEKCEGKAYCELLAETRIFGETCFNVYKYLNVEYNCVKDPYLKKERISLISFYNEIKSNTLQEHSVSEFYQYANIHNYEYQHYHINYVPERQIYFMKFYVLIEKLIEGLKNKSIDWLVWVDSDISIINPNIKLEAFLPDENMSKIHLIAGFDYLGRSDYCCGINSGVLFIRVHQWSLDILMRSISYPYFNGKKVLSNPDQIALNNLLIEANESDHYVIASQDWFNNRRLNHNSFFMHFMAGNTEQKTKQYKEACEKIKDDKGFYERTNEEVRKEVLKYYALPKEEQIKIHEQP